MADQVRIVSELHDGMDNIADAIRTLAGAICTVAAGAHSNDCGDQRNMSGVFYADACAEFRDVLRKLDAKQQEALQAYVAALIKPPKKAGK